VSDCKNNDFIFLDIFAGSSAEERCFQPTHVAFGGVKPSGFCSACLYRQAAAGLQS
jgi:hypothetical protein